MRKRREEEIKKKIETEKEKLDKKQKAINQQMAEINKRIEQENSFIRDLKNVAFPCLIEAPIIKVNIGNQTQNEGPSTGINLFNLREEQEAQLRIIQPIFPGGDDKLNEYISQNIVYPQKAIKSKIKGTVIVAVYFDDKGKIIRSEILKSVHKLLDDEALRLINSMPNWEPAKDVNGVATEAMIHLPITFKLE